jgi:hypothetical protein
MTKWNILIKQIEVFRFKGLTVTATSAFNNAKQAVM